MSVFCGGRQQWTSQLSRPVFLVFTPFLLPIYMSYVYKQTTNEKAYNPSRCTLAWGAGPRTHFLIPVPCRQHRHLTLEKYQNACRYIFLCILVSGLDYKSCCLLPSAKVINPGKKALLCAACVYCVGQYSAVPDFQTNVPTMYLQQYWTRRKICLYNESLIFFCSVLNSYVLKKT